MNSFSVYPCIFIPELTHDTASLATPSATPIAGTPLVSPVLSDPFSEREWPHVIATTNDDEAERERCEKRLRNTAASARFRKKKKAHEAATLAALAEMKKKQEQLEAREKELEKEILWLKALVVEPDRHPCYPP